MEHCINYMGPAPDYICINDEAGTVQPSLLLLPDNELDWSTLQERGTTANKEFFQQLINDNRDKFNVPRVEGIDVLRTEPFVHIEFDEFKRMMERSAYHCVKTLTPDEYAVLYVPCFSEQQGACFTKSNVWASMLFFDIVGKYIDDVCMVANLHDLRETESYIAPYLRQDRRNVVIFVDDAIYSGMQWKNQVKALYNHLNKMGPPLFCIHTVCPYISRAFIRTLNMKPREQGHLVQLQSFRNHLLQKDFDVMFRPFVDPAEKLHADALARWVQYLDATGSLAKYNPYAFSALDNSPPKNPLFQALKNAFESGGKRMTRETKSLVAELQREVPFPDKYTDPETWSKFDAVLLAHYATTCYEYDGYYFNLDLFEHTSLSCAVLMNQAERWPTSFSFAHKLPDTHSSGALAANNGNRWKSPYKAAWFLRGQPITNDWDLIQKDDIFKFLRDSVNAG